MVVLTVRFDLSIFAAALRAAPSTTLEFEECFPYSDRHLRLVVHARGEALDTFEAALDESEAVAEVNLLSVPGSTRVYRVLVPRDGWIARGYETIVDHDGYVVSGRASADGWTVRLSFPERQSVASFTEFCSDAELRTVIRSVQPRRDADESCEYGLTRVQSETLRTALAAGYFEVPRRATLDDLARELDVSDQAVSERIRRGTARLVANTVEQVV